MIVGFVILEENHVVRNYFSFSYTLVYFYKNQSWTDDITSSSPRSVVTQISIICFLKLRRVRSSYDTQECDFLNLSGVS